MNNFNLATLRKDFITRYMTDKYKGILTDSDIKIAVNKAIELYDRGQYVTVKRQLGNVIRAEDVNETLKELFVDIGTIYSSINSIDKKVTDSLDNSVSILNKVEADGVKGNLILDEYESFMRSRGNPAYRVENFKTRNSFEHDINIYRERYGERVGQFTAGVYEDNCSSLVLPKTRCANLAYYSDGVIAARATINRQFGSANSETRVGDTFPSNVIIPNNKKIWEENIYTDEPIEITESNVHYNINNGALCELVIDFESVTILNELLLMPYGKYPIDILAIKYSITDASDEELKYLVTKNNVDKSLHPKTLSEPVVYRFSNTMVKKLHIVINQLHYVRNAFIYNTNNALRNDVIFSLNSKNVNSINLRDDIIFKPNYQDRVEYDPSWALINEMTSSYKEIDIDKILFKSSGEDKRAIKYHYNYGLSSVVPRNNEFDRTGIYVSKTIDDVGNIRNIRLSSEEVHPINKNGDIVTDVEYYVTHATNPKWSDWVSILPKNKYFIECELLQMYDDLCHLRFPALSIEEVTMDDQVLSNGIDYWEKKDKNGDVYALEIPDFDFVSAYTISYNPNPVYSNVDMSESEKITSVDQFKGTNNSFFNLKNSTYTTFTSADNNEDTYVKILDADTGKIIASDKNGVKCVTDPYSSYDSYKNFDNKSSEYQYYTHKNYLYFNKPIPKNIKVEISYRHYVNQIRVKAILRRNTKYDKHISPVVNSIKYEIVTAD